jgi:hypothetical protein
MTALKSFFELPKWTFTLGAILLMFWTMAGCVSSKGDVPDYLSEQSKNPPLMTECQLLLSEVEVVEQGIARRRRLYPLSSRLRLSEQAAMNGFNAATRKEAMIFFNQAWRFNPENPMAFWGAGIVRGCEALKYCEENNFDIARKCWMIA